MFFSPSDTSSTFGSTFLFMSTSIFGFCFFSFLSSFTFVNDSHANPPQRPIDMVKKIGEQLKDAQPPTLQGAEAPKEKVSKKKIKKEELKIFFRFPKA